MEREALIQHLTPPPGVKLPPYPAWRDKVYRWALATASFGLLVYGVGLLSRPVFMSAGAAVVAVATLVAAYMFLVWVVQFRWLVLALAILGTGLLGWAAAWGMGFLLAALSVMAAKETHCFHFPTGKVIPWLSLVIALSALFPTVSLATGVGYLVLAVMWALLVQRRFRLPLFEL